MRSYLDLAHRVLREGTEEDTGATLASTGRKSPTRALFGESIRHDMSDGFPILTTKKMPLKVIAAELAFFLRGETNVEFLHARGCHIWDQWAGRDGELGPVYGAQWRRWSGWMKGLGQVHRDQLKDVFDALVALKSDAEDRRRRRMILSAWNVTQLHTMALPPCHHFVQFNVLGDRLSLLFHMRSVDVFLGLPFNLASYGLFLLLMAEATDWEPGELIGQFGDTHVYENHVDQMYEQIDRRPRELPMVGFRRPFNSFDDLVSFDVDDVLIDGYEPHPALRGEVAV